MRFHSRPGLIWGRLQWDRHCTTCTHRGYFGQHSAGPRSPMPLTWPRGFISPQVMSVDPSTSHSGTPTVASRERKRGRKRRKHPSPFHHRAAHLLGNGGGRHVVAHVVALHGAVHEADADAVVVECRRHIRHAAQDELQGSQMGRRESRVPRCVNTLEGRLSSGVPDCGIGGCIS
jgi:hypothetical protein